MQVVSSIESLSVQEKTALNHLKSLYDILDPCSFMGYDTARLLAQSDVYPHTWDLAVQCLTMLSNSEATGAIWLDAGNLVECWLSRKSGLVFIAKPIAIL